jgi:uncharacterized YccA/Bax inhibitor family protein
MFAETIQGAVRISQSFERGVMSITVIVVVLVLLVIGVAAFGMRREQAEHPAGAQALAVLLLVVVAGLILAYMVLQRGR